LAGRSVPQPMIRQRAKLVSRDIHLMAAVPGSDQCRPHTPCAESASTSDHKMHNGQPESKRVRLPERGGVSPLASFTRNVNPQNDTAASIVVASDGVRALLWAMRLLPDPNKGDHHDRKSNSQTDEYSTADDQSQDPHGWQWKIGKCEDCEQIHQAGRRRNHDAKAQNKEPKVWVFHDAISVARWSLATKSSQQSLRLSCRLRLLLVSRPQDQVRGNHCQWDGEIQIGETPLVEVQ
jgi:hypothetical protein